MIPSQDRADMSDPEEHLAWAMIAMPAFGQALVTPPEVLRTWSTHLYKCGFRHDPECQEISWSRPGPVDWTNPLGAWIPTESMTTSPATQSPVNVDDLTDSEKAALLDALAENGLIRRVTHDDTNQAE